MKSKIVVGILFLILSSSFGYTQKFDGGYRGSTISGLKVPKNALSFLVIGDWGRSGEYFQKETAVQLGRASYTIDAEWIVSTGDNIYPKGVASVSDPMWKRSFEDIYTAHSLMISWYPVLGNHDYAGDPEAEIAYSKISRRWNMPSRYYSFERVTDEGVKVLFLYIDSSPFEKKYYKDGEEPFRSNIISQDTTAQKNWVLNTLKQSNAEWKFVFGHHPLYSAGKRKGLTDDVASSVLPLLQEGGADIYMSGHEHHLQHDQLTKKIHHFISGAGSEITPVTNNKLTKFVSASHGFFTVSINKEGCLFQAIDHEGKILYTTVLKK